MGTRNFNLNSRAAGYALAACGALLMSGCGGSGGSADPQAHNLTAARACEEADGKVMGDARLKAAVVAAGGDVPVYCKVQGVIGTSLHFEMRLPERWNGKLHFWGGGGYDGFIQAISGPDANSRIPLVALKAGYATVSSDGGHQSELWNASFALANPEAARMFGSLSVPTVTASAQKILTSIYGAAPGKSYFEGCSNGGREGMVSMQRYPKLFDGIIVRAPAYNWAGLMGHFSRNAKVAMAPGARLSADKLALVARTVRHACDALDGITDGVVANPAACTPLRINLPALRCDGGADLGRDCLSDAQMAVFQSWTTEAVFQGGSTFRNTAWNLNGNEDDPLNMAPWLTGNGNPITTEQYRYADTTIKNYLARDPHADSLGYSYDSNIGALVDMAALNDATEPDISPFIKNGGKLIMWHGGADPGINMNSTIDYYDRMRKAVGDVGANAATRLYIAPGVNHCASGVGADTVDLLAALDQWSSGNTAPATLNARKLDAGGAEVLSRPLCEYPQYPRYVGAASDATAARLASSYVCMAP